MKEIIKTLKHGMMCGKNIYEFLCQFGLQDYCGKKRKEFYQIGKFLYEWKDEIKSIQSDECPDFIVEFKTGEKIGIELTSITTSKIGKINSTEELCCNASKIFQEKHPNLNFLVNISFVDNCVSFKKEEIGRFANEIAGYAFALINGNDKPKPIYIKNLRFQKHTSFYINNTTYWFVENLTIEKLQDCIKKKEGKLPSYKKEHPDIDKFWLFITLEKSPGSFDLEENIDYRIDSSFDKIFILTDFYERTIVVK